MLGRMSRPWPIRNSIYVEHLPVFLVASNYYLRRINVFLFLCPVLFSLCVCVFFFIGFGAGAEERRVGKGGRCRWSPYP